MLKEFGLAIVFGNVLLEQLGLPIPAVPTMIAGGATAMDGHYSLASVFVVGVAACIVGDGVWYVLGRRLGSRVLKLMCRISLSADSCVRQTSLQFERWGAWALLFGKFIPGVSAVSSPLAGVMRMGWGRFLWLSTLGSAIWVGIAVAIGASFQSQVNAILARLQDLGIAAAIVLGVLLAGYIAFKWWERRRIFEALRMARITVDELHDLIEKEREPFVVDLRTHTDRAADGRSIPGALAMALPDIEDNADAFPRDRDIIFYCNCPNEASAAAAAKALMGLGFVRVRPLAGGLDAWADAGYEVDTVEAVGESSR